MSWRGLPVFGLFLFVVAGLMVAPFLLSVGAGDLREARAFGLSIVMIAIVATLISVARHGQAGRSHPSAEFLTLFGVLLIGPAVAALPLVFLLPQFAFEAIYFEMVSSLTTTGATVFDRPGELSASINLWRALTAWLGGFVALVMAFALLAPRNLGGYEVRGADVRGGAIGRLNGLPTWAGGDGREPAGDRIESAVRGVLPVYVALTAMLAVGLAAVGQPAFKALTSALSLMSTSGVEVDDAGMFADVGAAGEVLAAVFLIFAASRHMYRGRRSIPDRLSRFRGDPEMHVLAGAVLGATAWLFLRHWLGALDLEPQGDLTGPLSAIWGGFFTALSFATTTGVTSASWDAARMWSGLSNPGLILFALAVMGGGIASTAGGVKLLRAYALYRHGLREMSRLAQPSSVSGAVNRGLRREGAQIAWVFLMLFMVALGVTMLALSLTGSHFELNVAAAVAALSNTGPLMAAAEPGASWLTSISPEGRVVIMVAMILGRVETLAVIAMLNPGNWR